MVQDLLDQHRQTLILVLSVLILVGSGISIGVGVLETQNEAKTVPLNKSTGLATADNVLGSADASVSYPIDINSATSAQLDLLPGIGSTRAKAIVDYRQANGLFKSTAEIMDVPGIGPKTYEKIKSLITIK